jgi:hypothetical protein
MIPVCCSSGKTGNEHISAMHKLARRAILPHGFGIDEIRNSELYTTPARLATRDVSADRRQT